MATEEVREIWVCKTSENYAKLKLVYDDFGAPIFSIEDFESEKFDVWSIGVEPRKIEILTKVSGLVFEESFEKCNWLEVELCKVPYIDFEDLIHNKKST